VDGARLRRDAPPPPSPPPGLRAAGDKVAGGGVTGGLVAGETGAGEIGVGESVVVGGVAPTTSPSPALSSSPAATCPELQFTLGRSGLTESLGDEWGFSRVEIT